MTVVKYIIVGLSLLICLSMTGCILLPAPRYVKIDDGWEGVVINVQNNEPIANALVTRRCGIMGDPHFDTTTTNANGIFKFDSCWEFRFWYFTAVGGMSTCIDGSASLKVKANGYESSNTQKNIFHDWFFPEGDYQTIFMKPVAPEE
ncbi:MAG: hypothetical protein JEZ07_04105 [Phycisphaerae bacterium]|nr:hypothetical protein [Phycisphaerae bacterium]